MCLTDIQIWNEKYFELNVSWWCSTHAYLAHWGRVTHICVGKLIIIGWDNGFSLGRRQAIIWTNAGIWSMGSLGTNFNEIITEIHTFSFWLWMVQGAQDKYVYIDGFMQGCGSSDALSMELLRSCTESLKCGYINAYIYTYTNMSIFICICVCEGIWKLLCI